MTTSPLAIDLPPATRQRGAAPPARLRVIGSTYQAVRLMAETPLTLDDEICAYVAGIRVGSDRIEGVFEPGDIIEYPVSYLPWVELPAEIRFVAESTGVEVSEPFRIAHHDEAVSLVGIGEAVVQNVAIEKGMIRGLVVNRVNGLLRPQMFARINGVVPRAITVEQPRLLDDGGASFQFAAPLSPADLGENGLTADIFLLGQDTPLTSIAFRRADVDDMTKRIVEFEAQLAQISQSTAFRLNGMDGSLSRRLDLLQQRMDTFIEYAASFMFDRVAAVEVPSLPGAPARSPELSAKVDAFLSAVRGNGPANEPQAVPDSETVPLGSGAFAAGWFEMEEENGVSLRWMSGDGQVANPHPDRPVAEVRLALAGVYGSGQPMLRAAFDGVPVAFHVERSKRRGGGWKVRIVPPKGAEGAKCSTLSLASMFTGSPERADGAEESRLLSIAVSELTFVYAG